MDMASPKKEFPKCFPSNFATEILPQGLPDQEIAVYRVCTTDTICKDAFLSTYEEVELKGKKPPVHWKTKKKKPGGFSVSCNDTLEGALNPLKCLRRPYPGAFLIYGMASSELGPIQRTVEREPEYDDETHLDWWLYADSDPSPGFDRVEVPEDSEEPTAVSV